MNDATGRIIRTLLQFVVAGGLYEIVNLVNADLQSPYLLPLYAVLVAVLQNLAEEFGIVKAVMKPAPSATTPRPPSQ